MIDEMTERLIAATRWPDIHQCDESYVIRFDYESRNSIHGLRQNKSTFHLTFEEFNAMPLTFLVKMEDYWLFEYWTVGGRLHRSSGKPSYVSLNGAGQFDRRWHWHDITHRLDGPAIETGQIFDPDPTKNYEGFEQEAYTTLKQSWYINGYVRSPFAGPSTINYENVIFYKNSTGLCASPLPETQAIGASEVEIRWNITDNKDVSGLYPDSIKINNFKEYRPEGQYTGRVASSVTFTWRKDFWSKFNTPGCSQWAHEHIFHNSNLWEGPFFPSEIDEYTAITEMDRVRDNGV